MIDRGRYYRLFTIAGLAFATTGLLGIAAGPAVAQTYEDKCSDRRDRDSCHAECDDGDPNTPPPFLADCHCLWDDRNPQEVVTECPPGEVCCWNMPCFRWDAMSAFDCILGGGGRFEVSEGGEGGELFPKNCSSSEDLICGCAWPLVPTDYTAADFESAIRDQYTAPFDCLCPFTSVEEWLDTGVCIPPVPDSKKDCQKNGWRTHTRADGSPFANQKACLQYLKTAR